MIKLTLRDAYGKEIEISNPYYTGYVKKGNFRQIPITIGDRMNLAMKKEKKEKKWSMELLGKYELLSPASSE